MATERARPARGALLLGLGMLAAPAIAPGPGAAQAGGMNAMEHGPFISSTITTDPTSPRGILVHKGIAVSLGEGATMVLDTDLLRVAGAWTGGSLHWLPPRDALQEWPTPDGHVHFLNPPQAGWAVGDNLADPRGGSATLNNARRYGPIGGDRRYDGLHLHGDTVVFALSVGKARVLERFGFHRVRSEPVFTRTLEVGATPDTLSLLVAPAPFGRATRLEQNRIGEGTGFVAVRSGDELRLIGFRGLPAGARWLLEGGHLALSLPAAAQTRRFRLSIGPVRPASGGDAYMREHLRADPGSLDLARFLRPGPSRYPAVETRARMGVSRHGPFAVDDLVPPRDNPWNSHLRLSAVDFLSDGRAVVASMSGDVWLVDGVREELSTLRWKRFATGLNQPLGLVVVRDTIYVNGRDQITRLHDLDRDGHADRYENFNNEVMAATNFHAFNLNLEVDSRGRFLWAKSTPWPAGNPANPADAHEITPHHGVLFRLSPDGRELETIANGLRNPNGLSVGPGDEIFYSDNEGNWVPTSKVTRIVEGGFHGFVPSAHRAGPLGGWTPTDEWVKPMLWTPHAGPGSDNSPAQPRVIDNPAWPAELQGQLLLASYGRGTLSLILREEVDGQPQAAHMVLPLEFRSGLLQSRFHRDGHLYLVGLTNWSSTSHGGERGSFHRVRYTGAPLHLPVALNTRAGGLELRFGAPLDPASATDPARYRLSRWSYTWNSSYGARQFHSLDRPGETGVDSMAVRSVTLSGDGRTVFLDIPSLKPGPVGRVPVTGTLPNQVEASLGMIVQIDYDLRAADGTRLDQLIHKTIHRVPGAPHAGAHRGAVPPPVVRDAPGAARPAPSTPPAVAPAVEPAERGRVVVIRSVGTELAYDPAVIRARAGERLTVRYENVGEMTHNFVLVRSHADVPVVGEAAFQAAFTNQWIPTGAVYRDRVLAHTPLAGPREVVETTFVVPPAGEYPFICTFASHWTVMRGRLLVE